MKTIINNKKQKGFSILAVILVIVAVIVAIGVWAISGQTNTNNSGNSTSDIQASSIINDSAAIKLAYDNLIVNGASASSIVFIPNTASTSTAPNILDPTTGIQAPKPNASAIKASPGATEGYWVYQPTNFIANSIGTATNDVVILLPGVKQGVCQRINYIIHGTTTLPASYGNSALAATGATASAPTTSYSMNMNAVPGLAGWMMGCTTTTAGGDDNVFFRVLKVY